jgi:hypothetical protein
LVLSWSKIRLHVPTTLELAVLIKSRPECLSAVRSWQGLTEESEWEVTFHEEQFAAEQNPLVASGQAVGHEMCVLMLEISLNDLHRLQESRLAYRYTMGVGQSGRRLVKIYPGGISRLANWLSGSPVTRRATVDFVLVSPLSARQQLSAGALN